MYVKELEHNRYIFQFYHDLDLKLVNDGSPWTFNKTQFVFAKLVPGVDPRAMITNHLDMWVQVHGLQFDFKSDMVLKDLENYIGSFVETDPKNFQGLWRDYLHVRVTVDITTPLKRKMKIRKNERHSKKFYPKAYGLPLESVVKPYRTDQQLNGEIPTITNASHPNLVQKRKETNMAAGVAAVDMDNVHIDGQLIVLDSKRRCTLGGAVSGLIINGPSEFVGYEAHCDGVGDGYPYTWERGKGGASWTELRLDRALKKAYKTKPDRDEDQPTDEERDEVDDEADRATTNSPTNPMKTNMKHTDVEEEELDRQWEMLPLHFVRWFDECDPTHLANMGNLGHSCGGYNLSALLGFC
uniref:DUF4283 domain-containing protein n=1 Tax=Cannabis sativa TaxID=3483 RepID=A0A803PY19_CANSA